MGRKSSGSVQRVREALAQAGVATEILELASSTRTAQEAATAAGCDVGQIVKSLVLKGAASNGLYLVLTSGRNRVCMDSVATLVGESVGMADAASVREATGFAIGGVPPLAHRERLTTIIDEALLSYTTIWAAAGSPNAIFPLTPADLLRLTGGRPAVVGAAC